VSAIRLHPDELDLLARMIDKRESAHLSGHRNDRFLVATPNGDEWVLRYPGGMGAETVPARTIERLRELDTFQLVREGRNALTFDLADQPRDLLEQLKAAAGQPSELARLDQRRAQIEEQLGDCQKKAEADARERAQRRRDFAAHLGHWTNVAVTVALVGLYLVAAGLPLVFATNVVGIVISALMLAAFGVLGWRFHIDAWRGANAAQAWVERRAERWLRRFETYYRDEPGW
jgi:hypothetical protein